MACVSQSWRAPPHPRFALGGSLEAPVEFGPRNWVRSVPLPTV